MAGSMTSLERLLAVINGEKPDYIPVFPLLNEHAAKMVSMSVIDYFRNPQHLAEGQMALVKHFGHDFLLAFTYLAREAAALGVPTFFHEDESPTTGKPVVSTPEELLSLEIPDFHTNEQTAPVLQQISEMVEKSNGEYPIIGVATGPFSLPTMIMGNDQWLTALFMEELGTIKKVLEFTREFTSQWANAQLEAGCHAVGIVEGSATRSIVPEDVFVDLVKPVLASCVKQIDGITVILGVGGEIEPYIPHIGQTGIAGAVISTNDSIQACKSLDDKLIIFGNVNNLEFIDYSPENIDTIVKSTIEAGKGGRFVLSTQYVLPVQVTEEQIKLFVESSRRYGKVD
ncbi:MAG: uroporphyrinogen decarboxylase family protein [Candidatus Odinarchaeota archaeon]